MLVLSLLIVSTAFAQQGNLQRSEKKTLFVFPVEFDGETMEVPKGEVEWARSQFLEIYVNTFERFDYIEMPEVNDLESFLADSKTYIEEHAREIVQKRKEPDGRIREVRVTVDDLKEAVQNGYVFFPEVTHVKKNEKKVKNQKKKEITFDVNMHIEVYRAINGEIIETVAGSTDNFGAILGSFRTMATGFANMDGADSDEKKEFRMSIEGVYEEMKVYLRQMGEFQLKAVAFDTGFNGFNIDLGKTMGIRMDRRYKAWSLDNDGKPNEMLAFGKVRKVNDEYSRVQILIGNVGEGDQVLEDARFGLNIAPQFMILPYKLEGFDDMGLFINAQNPGIVFAVPEDTDGSNISLGLSLEYNIAWVTNVSELYIVLDGGWIPDTDIMVWNGMFGLRKKVFFRRVGLFGTVKVGGIGVEFLDTDMFDDDDVEDDSDAVTIGVGVDVGAEVLITPNLSLRGQVGYYGFPKQSIITGYDLGDDKWKTATLTSAGVTFGLALSYTL